MRPIFITGCVLSVLAGWLALELVFPRERARQSAGETGEAPAPVSPTLPAAQAQQRDAPVLPPVLPQDALAKPRAAQQEHRDLPQLVRGAQPELDTVGPPENELETARRPEQDEEEEEENELHRWQAEAMRQELGDNLSAPIAKSPEDQQRMLDRVLEQQELQRRIGEGGGTAEEHDRYRALQRVQLEERKDVVEYCIAHAGERVVEGTDCDHLLAVAGEELDAIAVALRDLDTGER